MPDMEQLVDVFDAVLAFLVEHRGYFLGLLGAALAGLLAAWRARRRWLRRQFLTRVNFSVNYIERGTLRFRTLRESELEDVLLQNEHGRKLVVHAAQKTTLEQPILQFAESDAWVVLNSILNEISEQFAAGFLAASMGLPVRTMRYVFALTCEKDRDVRSNKLRVLLIAEPTLEKLDQYGDLEVERPNHRVRLNTLRRMKAMLADPKAKHNLLTVELAAPSSASVAIPS